MDRRKKGEYIGALGALLVHVAVIALLILVSFTVPQPDEDAEMCIRDRNIRYWVSMIFIRKGYRLPSAPHIILLRSVSKKI